MLSPFPWAEFKYGFVRIKTEGTEKFLNPIQILYHPNSTDGMLFVLSWPNRPKGQTNNKRKGEKYGNWSYSYHRW